ncbi:MAG: HTTM domain-containing protein [Myxococcota bacterium]
MTGLRARWAEFWHGEIDAAPLALFGKAFALTMLVYFGAWALHATEWSTAAGYHPSVHLDPVNSPQLPLLPEAALYLVGPLFFASLLAYIFGYARRVVVWVLLAGAVYAMQVDPISSFTLNRLYVIGLFVLAIAPATRSVGADETGADETGADETGERQRAWPTRMLQLLVVTMYGASGLCKAIHGDWWGGQDVLWMQVQGFYMTDAAAWMVRTLPHWAWDVQQQLALWFELLAPLLFALRRLRPLAFVLGLGLHLVVAVTMEQLIYFSLQMACFYLLFIPPAWARRLLRMTTVSRQSLG